MKTKIAKTWEVEIKGLVDRTKKAYKVAEDTFADTMEEDDVATASHDASWLGRLEAAILILESLLPENEV